MSLEGLNNQPDLFKSLEQDKNNTLGGDDVTARWELKQKYSTTIILLMTLLVCPTAKRFAVHFGMNIW